MSRGDGEGTPASASQIFAALRDFTEGEFIARTEFARRAGEAAQAAVRNLLWVLAHENDVVGGRGPNAGGSPPPDAPWQDENLVLDSAEQGAAGEEEEENRGGDGVGSDNDYRTRDGN
jgi:hypothetical protein